MIEAYPLYWPEGRPRTRTDYREHSRFDTSFSRARDEVIRQIELMTGRYEWMRKEADLIISTNLPLRRDGLPLASARTPDDSGVAVYFVYKKRRMCFACDRWVRIEDNMQAIAKTIDALRGITRWGTGDMLEAAFRGFTALPSPDAASNWRVVLGFDPGSRPTSSEVDAQYRRLAHVHHPDRQGGSADQMQRLNKARDDARRELS